MDRPPSQLENVRPSAIRPPSRLPAALSNHTTGRTLLETSQSDLNTRNGPPSSLTAPSSGPVKHKIPGLPEPAPKRKTLAERAGEPFHPTRSQLPPPSKSSMMRPPSTIGHGRNGSLASSVPATNGSRYDVRQARETDADAEADTGIMGKRKGTPTLSFNHIALRKTRTHSGNLRRRFCNDKDRDLDDSGSASEQMSSCHTSGTSTISEASSRSMPPQHNASLTLAFADLSLFPKPRHPSTAKHSPSLERIKEEVSNPSKIPNCPCTSSLRPVHSTPAIRTPLPAKHKSHANSLCTPHIDGREQRRGQADMLVFLTKDSLTPVKPAWDTKGRLEDMERMYGALRTQLDSAADSKTALEESLSLYKTRIQELTAENKELSTHNRSLIADIERARADLHTTTTDLRQARRDHDRTVQDLERRHEREMADLTHRAEKEAEMLARDRERDVERAQRDMEEARREWERKKNDEVVDLTTAHWEEIANMEQKHAEEKALLQRKVDELERAGASRATESANEVQELRDTISKLQGQLDAANVTATSLREAITAERSRHYALEQEKAALVSKTHFLEGNQEAQSLEFTNMRQALQDAIATKEATLVTLRKEEMLRRKLNATILELRGNIRVFVRTRPLLTGEDEPAKVEYPDIDALDGGHEMVVHAPTTFSATGKERNEKHAYAFDRVFGAGAANDQVFEECRDLIQSVVDGYNVSILSYGQTGSGKTYGMSGPSGIIPSSIALLLAEMHRLRDKGWEYSVEASFVEVYNETLNDLLGDAKTWDEADDTGGSVRAKKKEKHEIHHDNLTGKTTVTNLTSVTLWPPPENEGHWHPAASVASGTEDTRTSYTEQAVTQLLETAAKNRRVAATKANERSSRSHSIFMLTLRGQCAATNEVSEGVLNLVDLAGSERLKQSGAEGSRAKETAAINKSLSSLGDVIAALGNKKGDESHIPYRNSKLTYLLQSSLGGTAANGKSSRTLMLLHLSPLQAHWQESRSSLLFGSKVIGAHIGAAKKR